MFRRTVGNHFRTGWTALPMEGSIRIYGGKKNKSFVIILIGGDKKTQAADIKRAKAYWEDYQVRSAGQ
jgi:hypothetical protein